MSIELQWLIVAPLVVLFVGVVWLVHAREVKVDDRQGDAPDSSRPYIRRVFAKFELHDWGALVLAAIYMAGLIANTIQ